MYENIDWNIYTYTKKIYDFSQRHVIDDSKHIQEQNAYKVPIS